MKRVVLLSTVASAILFGGGDIAPVVEPEAPASADFWGQLGFAYQAQDANYENPGDFSDKENNAFSATIILGVEKNLGNGFGFGAEVAGWSDFGLDIADKPRAEGGDQTGAEVSQAYLTYTFEDTAIKAGRQALPKAVSPWVWSDRTAGVLDWTYDGIVIANTSLSDTTLIGAWIPHLSHNDIQDAHSSDSSGAFMLAMVNKSISDTVITVNGYYIPESELNAFQASKNGLISTKEDTWSIWANFISKFDGFRVGMQGAYVDGDESGWDATYGIAGKIGSTWDSFDIDVIAAYINDGDYSLSAGGGGTSVEDSGFWSDIYDVSGVTYGADQWSIQTRMSYEIGIGKLYGAIGYWDFDTHSSWGDEKSAWTTHIGYRFTVWGMNTKVEYRYRNFEYYNSGDKERQRIRLESYYKF